MATPNIIEASLFLSRMIHDPVAVGTDKGLIYTAQQRLDYMNRGYWSMMKSLEAVHKDMSFIFPDYVDTTEIIYVADQGRISLDQLKLGTYYEIYDVYYQAPDNPLKRAIKIAPENYYSIDLGVNQVYPKPLTDPTQKDDPLHYYNRAYWTILKGSVRMMPSVVDAEYMRVIIVHKKDFVTFQYNEGEDINLAKNYYDLFLFYAAREAYVDDGNMAKYQIASAQIGEQLKMIGAVKAQYIRNDKNRSLK